jgi:hypothetical protein
LRLLPLVRGRRVKFVLAVEHTVRRRDNVDERDTGIGQRHGQQLGYLRARQCVATGNDVHLGVMHLAQDALGLGLELVGEEHEHRGRGAIVVRVSTLVRSYTSRSYEAIRSASMGR